MLAWRPILLVPDGSVFGKGRWRGRRCGQIQTDRRACFSYYKVITSPIDLCLARAGWKVLISFAIKILVVP